MSHDYLSRRSLLAVAGGCALAGATVSGATDDENDDQSRDSFLVREGTDEETPVYVTTAADDGPTVVVVGGVHGNEVAGYAAAGEVADWTIEAGRLVTIPEANAVAVGRGTRTDDDGVDLNRQFPKGGEPGTELARAIWDVVVRYDADVVVDLHESRGVYAGDPVDGVGQAIFHSDGAGAAETALAATEFVNRDYVDDAGLAFETGSFTGPDTEPSGLLVHKAARDLDAESFLVETLSTGVDLETRVQWHLAIVERLVRDELFPDDGHSPEEPVDGTGEPEDGSENPGDGSEDPENGTETSDEDDPEEDDPGEDDSAPDREAPIARIRTDPECADERALESGQTATLDASSSCAPDGEIVRYEWDVADGGCFDERGETLEVTVSASGDHPITVRVVDDAGLTGTETIVLSVD